MSMQASAPASNQPPDEGVDPFLDLFQSPGRHADPPALARTQAARVQVRCECRMCGAHAYALPAIPMSGRCGNCHSFDLVPVREVSAATEPRPLSHFTPTRVGVNGL